MTPEIAERPVSELRPGDHATFAFTAHMEQAQVIGPFIGDGLDAGEKAIYISDLRPGQLPGLCGRSDIDRRAETGQLQVICRSHACLTGDRFDPERMLTVIGRQIGLAVEQGYSAVRITADLSWVLDQPGGLPRMLACEAGFEETISSNTAIMAICQLDRSRCRPGRLRVLRDIHHLRVTADPVFDDGVLRIVSSHAPVGLRLAGELDAARHRPLAAALNSMGTRCAEVHLDFARVRFVDLGTFGLLVNHVLRMPSGHSLVLDDLPADVTDLIQTLGWSRLPGLIRGRPRPS